MINESHASAILAVISIGVYVLTHTLTLCNVFGISTPHNEGLQYMKHWEQAPGPDKRLRAPTSSVILK